MASRTQIVCLCEGAEGSSIDGVFINKLMRTLKPSWIRKTGTNYVRIKSCGGRKEVISAMPGQLRLCLDAGSDTTLMVWADCDDNCDDGDALKDKFWKEAQESGITRDDFDHAVFIFAKYRIENWIEFLTTRNTDESQKGPRVKHNREVAEAAKKLALKCSENRAVDNMPPSLQWSCKNWQALVKRMKKA